MFPSTFRYVLKVELADIAFAVDAILAAVAKRGGNKWKAKETVPFGIMNIGKKKGIVISRVKLSFLRNLKL
ncbi:hypothetical protein J14TS5_60720 [Paenibacillus lautus]|nr:hypothetical protein J14TS5_60720 [Paenibacillus lautus]